MFHGQFCCPGQTEGRGKAWEEMTESERHKKSQLSRKQRQGVSLIHFLFFLWSNVHTSSILCHRTPFACPPLLVLQSNRWVWGTHFNGRSTDSFFLPISHLASCHTKLGTRYVTTTVLVWIAPYVQNPISVHGYFGSAETNQCYCPGQTEGRGKAWEEMTEWKTQKKRNGERGSVSRRRREGYGVGGGWSWKGLVYHNYPVK